MSDLKVSYDYRTQLYTVLEPYTRSIPVLPSLFGYTPEATENTRVEPDGFVTVTIPVGFITDGLTVPRFAWSIVRPIGDGFAAGVVHDLLYTEHAAGRPWADAVLRELEKEDGVPWWERLITYWFVRLGGRNHYD